MRFSTISAETVFARGMRSTLRHEGKISPPRHDFVDEFSQVYVFFSFLPWLHAFGKHGVRVYNGSVVCEARNVPTSVECR